MAVGFPIAISATTSALRALDAAEAARTRDGTYDVRVSEAMRLPDSVRTPDIDLARILAELLESYDQSGPDVSSPANSKRP
jgi:hypothetical protein